MGSERVAGWNAGVHHRPALPAAATATATPTSAAEALEKTLPSQPRPGFISLIPLLSALKISVGVLSGDEDYDVAAAATAALKELRVGV